MSRVFRLSMKHLAILRVVPAMVAALRLVNQLSSDPHVRAVVRPVLAELKHLTKGASHASET